MQRILNQIVPFILIGIAIVAFAFGIILLAYLFLFGAMVGFALFSLSWIKNKLFPHKQIKKPQTRPNQGRIIESDDWKKL